jgi:amino acid transporter
MSDKRPAVFARQASGLVREITWFNVFTFTATSIGFQFSLFFALSLTPLIGGNIGVGFLMMGVATLLVITAYTVLISMMPRAGGDYVYNSRILHPFIGFVGNLILGVTMLLFAAINSVTIESTSLSQLFAYFGVVYNQPGLLSWSQTIVEPSWIVGLGIVWIILGALVAIGPTRVYFRLQNIMLVVVVIGIIAIIASLIPVSHASFVSSFNKFVSQYNGTSRDYYSGVINNAQNAGWVVPDQTSLWLGLLLFPAVAFVGFNNPVSLLGGEMRQAKRSYFIGAILGAIYWLFFLGVCMLLVYNVIGFNFMSSIDYILYVSPGLNPLPATPYVNFLIATATSPLLAIIIFISGLVQLFVFIPNVYIAMSRGIFAYSFDGLLPKQLCDISPRTHGPLKAITASAAVTFIFFVIINVPQSATYAYLLASVGGWLETISALFVGFALIVLVLRKKMPELQATAPIRGFKLAVLGGLVVIFVGLDIYLYLTQEVYAANSPAGIGIAVGVIGAIAIIYVIRRLTNPNLSLAFKEIPP